MSEIRPVSDLRNKFAEISARVHEGKGVILTKNGYADMVVLSYEEYTRRRFEEEVYLKLMEAEMQARTTAERIPFEDVRAGLQKMIERSVNADV